MRIKLPREYYIPAGSIKIASKASPAVVYLTPTGNARPGAVGFYGKADKPSFNFSFKDEARRAKYVADWFASMDELASRKAARKAERKAFRHTLQVGDILRSSWGYDQTNIDYYEVTAVIGAMVEIRSIAQESEETEFMQGKCVPIPGQYVGTPTRHRPTEGNSVKVRSFAWAHKVEPMIVGGAKVYGSSHWTSYA